MTPFAAWTCPFCPLACDHLGVRAGERTLEPDGADCLRARRSLAWFDSVPAPVAPEVDGRPASLEDAIAAAARVLAASAQPLFAGLGTDVAGARALYPLACATGAIADAAGGSALMQGLRALQDRGQFTTTLAEVRTRADVIVFVGGAPDELAPLIRARCGIGDPNGPAREVIELGGPAAGALPLQGDLFDTLGVLAALLAERIVEAAPALQGLAQRLQAAKYAVLVGAPARLPAQGALLIEAVHRIVGELNRTTRAAALWVGGGQGAATANQVFTWLSGLPLRSRAGPRGLEHEPLAYDSAALLAGGAVDALLWVASFDAEAAPPATALPLVVLGHPALAAACRRPGRTSVFIPVATPGIGCDGHLFRTDGTVLMPLTAARPDTLPTVAQVAQQLLQALRPMSPAAEGQP
ncbi:MAG: formylmethanofuran dehydrogenase [Piscinibacter sp.]|nr:formylmethanofuran dehydrogenase [Piscinibacter sp.]